MVLDGQRMGDERDWVLVGFFVTCSSSAEKRFIRPAKQDEMGLWTGETRRDGAVDCRQTLQHADAGPRPQLAKDDLGFKCLYM